MSYSNMVMYGAVIPSYGGKKDGSTKGQAEEIKADDPRNKERVKQFFDSID